MSDVPNGSVTFTVKELLARQDGKLDSILIQLSGKAEKAELDRVGIRLDIVERVQAGAAGAQSSIRWVLPWLISIAAVGLALFERFAK